MDTYIDSRFLLSIKLRYDVYTLVFPARNRELSEKLVEWAADE